MSKNFADLLKEIIAEFNEPFLSEADFQHTLAWELHKKCKDAEIILEYPENYKDKMNYYDIYFHDEIYGTHLIELKYKTKKSEITRYGKKYSLRNQSAHDMGCYYFWQDVMRMENTKIKEVNEKYCIFLTNDRIYWQSAEEKKEEKAYYTNFKLNKNKNGEIYKYSGELKWNCSPLKSWMPKDKDVLCLRGTYSCSWQRFGKIDGWQYLFLSVPPDEELMQQKNE